MAQDGIEVKVRMVRLGVMGKTVARNLRRSEATISRAISRNDADMLARIHKFLDRVERKRYAQSPNLGQKVDE